MFKRGVENSSRNWHPKADCVVRGTKRQAQDAIAEEAAALWWLLCEPALAGRLLTNWVTVQKSVKRLKELDRDGYGWPLRVAAQKEVIKLERERKHLQANLAGIKDMNRLPDTVL